MRELRRSSLSNEVVVTNVSDCLCRPFFLENRVKAVELVMLTESLSRSRSRSRLLSPSLSRSLSLSEYEPRLLRERDSLSRERDLERDLARPRSSRLLVDPLLLSRPRSLSLSRSCDRDRDLERRLLRSRSRPRSEWSSLRGSHGLLRGLRSGLRSRGEPRSRSEPKSSLILRERVLLSERLSSVSLSLRSPYL